MFKKFSILLCLLLLFMSVAAASAADDVDMNLTSDDNLDAVEVSDVTEVISASNHTVTKDNYNQYFDNDGNLKDNVNSGDTIKLSGSFSNKNFVFNKTVNVVGDKSSKMSNSMFTFLSGSSGSSISNLVISNTNEHTCGVLINSASNCIIKGCIIESTGAGAYPICLANGATYNNVTDNDLMTHGESYGHGTRSTPTLVLFGSHHNTLANNRIQIEDANAIYLSSYGGGPFVSQESNYNLIFNNTINYNVLPTSWSYAIQVMGSGNIIKANKIIRAYRGITTTGSYNVITENQIINLTGANYNNKNEEVGGECGIAASKYSTVTNNYIINSKIISTGSGISVIDHSVVENNYVDVRFVGMGISAAGYDVVIQNNNIFTQSGVGIHEKDDGSGLLITKNNITSQSGIGVLIEQVSSKRMPSDVTITDNIIVTSNRYAIDASGVEANTGVIGSNIIGDKEIKYPAGVVDLDKPTYNYNESKTFTVNSSNIRQYINENGNLIGDVEDGVILRFQGDFSNEVIYVNKPIKIIGDNAKFLNSTFKVTSGGVWIENITIINKNAERLNAWGIYVNEAPGVKIINNDISVTDPNAAYAIYVLESSYVEVINNTLFSEGDFLTYTLLVYSSEECVFENNRISTLGTGEKYRYSPESSIEGKVFYINGTEYCVDGNEFCIDGVVYSLNGTEVCIDGVVYSLNGTEVCIDGVTYCLDGNELCIDGVSYCLDGNELCIDGVTYSIRGNEFCIDGVSYCLDGNEFCIDGVSYCLDGNELCIDGVTYCLDGNELCIDGVTYCLDGNELCIDGVSYNIENGLVLNGTTYSVNGTKFVINNTEYCIDGKTFCIDGVVYCLDGNELCIDGVVYSLNGTEVCIDGVTYCLDGNELCIDGVTYCLDGNELCIDGVSYYLNGTEVCIDGVTYCLDGNELCIDGVTYCLDGNELCIDGVSYCLDGNELVINGVTPAKKNHVVPEIYRTYGILLLYSSLNDVVNNFVNVTSKLDKVYPTTGVNGSENSIVGIDIYYNSHDNIVKGNDVHVSSNDNYIYGVGVLGYQTGHTAPEGQGATNNRFIENTITLEGPYATTGIIIGDESENTIIDGNIVNIFSNKVTYGINLEGSDDSTIINNVFILNSDVGYGIEGFQSDNNKVENNEINANGKQIYGMVFSGNNNKIINNDVFANGTGDDISFSAHDALGSGNAGIYLSGNATNNNIEGNNVTSQTGYAIVLESSGNAIRDNCLKSEKGSGNDAVNGTSGNTVEDNYLYRVTGGIETAYIPYLGNGNITLNVQNPEGASADGAVVDFYDDYGTLIGTATVLNQKASINYQLDESYDPNAQYMIKAILHKENFQVTEFETNNLFVVLGKLNVAVSDVSVKEGLRGKFTATVTNGLGKPVSGLTVKFYNYDTGNKQAWSTATTDGNGIATITYLIEEGFERDFGKVTNITAVVQESELYESSSGVGTLTLIDIAQINIEIKTKLSYNSALAVVTDNNGLAVANKSVSVSIDGKASTAKTNSNGEVILTSNKAGTHSVTVSSAKNDLYDAASASAKVTVVAAISGNKNANVYFGNTVQYKIRLADKNGNYLSKKSVSIKVNGKTVKCKTDANGYLTYSVKKVGTYTIVAENNGWGVSNKIVIKPTLTAKDITKKKAKKIKFSVKVVDKKGKVVKNKKVTFKIKSKKYTAKTNKKGVATATIKNLKVGKHTISSSYGGCTIKNTIKIKK